MEGEKFYLEADIVLKEETAARKEKASKVIDLPTEGKKQPDLQYFSAIFVSSGENLNHAYFLGSELVAAEGTIINKALDVEHSEDEIIGHIYERAFIDKDNNLLDLHELASRETASQDNQEMHIAIAGIIYKNRFPNIAKEVAEGKWKVSMECYFKDYDIKVGELIISRQEAEMLGLASQDESILGRTAKVLKKGRELAKGTVARVLRGICFSGCGVVKNPANPPSIIMETAKEKDKKEKSEEVIILDYDKLEEENEEKEEANNVTSDSVEDAVTEIEEARDGRLDDSTGICVNYKRRLLDKANQVVAEDWCSRYERGCTSFSRDTTDPDCLYHKELVGYAKACFERLAGQRAERDRRSVLLTDLKAALREAVKTRSRREE